MENFNEVQRVCVQVFEVVAKTTSLFVLPLFIGQIAFANASGGGSKAFEALKGVLVYFCLIIGFPLILQILFSIPESFLPSFSSIHSLQNGPTESDWSGMLPMALSIVLEVILSALYWLVYYLHIFFMLIMCSMAPIVFLCGAILGVGLGIEIFMGLLIIGSSWPIIWYGFDQVHAVLSINQKDEFALRCLELLLIISKGLAPVVFASVAIKSPVGRAVSSFARAGIQSVTKPISMNRQPAMFVPSSRSENKPNYVPPTNAITKRYLSHTGSRGKLRGMIDRLQAARNESEKPKGKSNENSRT